MVSSQRALHVGLVFQFPERHFLGHTLFDVRPCCLCACQCSAARPSLSCNAV